MTTRRFRAFLLCLLLLIPILPACAEEETFIPLTRSGTFRTENGVTVTGTRATADYATIRMLNPDTEGWLYQESTAYSQPILQGVYNDYYLTHTFDGTRYLARGSVLLDADAPSDFSGNAVYLRGFGRTEGCFSLFNEYTGQSWYEEHPSLRLLTPSGDWHAEVFACYRTTQSDEESWRVPEAEAAFSEWLSGILDKNLLTPVRGSVPDHGDRLMAMVINNRSPNRNIVLCTLRPITYDTQDSFDLVKGPLDSRESISGVRQISGLGEFIYYAQNDPVWDRMQYESERNPLYRVFGDGGCGPTAAAIAVANLVDAKELPRLIDHSANRMGTLMCPCSVNRIHCNHTHVPYLLQTPEEYLRYLPIAMADFAAGNNEWEIISRHVGSPGSSMRFLDSICDIFGITRTDAADLVEGLELLKGHAGKRIMICTALFGSPFTNTSHYVVVVGMDEEYFYVLDPLCRDSYAATDKREVLEILSPGVTRIRIADLWKSDLSPVYVMERPAQ